MANEKQLYDAAKPGQQISAERYNAMQEGVQMDIEAKIKSAMEQIKMTGVERADNADKFDNKTPKDWTDALDEHYAPLNHIHDGTRHYQRYFIELETVIAGDSPRLQPAVIIHNMSRNPVVQVYELEDLPITPLEGTSLPREYKFSICGAEHANDPEAIEFKTRSWDERHWGDQIDVMIEDLARDVNEEKQQSFRAQFHDNFTLNVWLSNLEKVVFEPGPGQYHFDMGDVYRTQWVKDRASKTVSELKNQGEWPPRFVYRPRLANFFMIEENIFVEIYHLNLNEVEIWPNTDQETHLMVLLRA